MLLLTACGEAQLVAVRSQGQQGALFPAVQGGGNYVQISKATATITLSASSQLFISFSATGWVTPLDTGSTFAPPLFIQCQVDGNPCPVGTSPSVPFLYPIQHQGDACCDYDTRTYTWVVDGVPAGTHTITMWGQFGQPSLAKVATISDWSLVVGTAGRSGARRMRTYQVAFEGDTKQIRDVPGPEAAH